MRAAARWLALLDSGVASDKDLQRLAQWRASSSLHEQAWHRQPCCARASPGCQGRWQWPRWTARMPADGRCSRALGVAAVLPAAWLASRELPLEAWAADLRTAVGSSARCC